MLHNWNMTRSLLSAELASQWSARNGQVRPDQVSAHSSVRYWWQCPLDPEHVWEATASSRSNGSGCPFCAGRRVVPGKTDMATLHPYVAAQWHPTRNDEPGPAELSPRSSRYAWWQCPVNPRHEWQARVSTRCRLHAGCPFCSGRRTCPGENDFATLHPQLAAQWHPTKNGDARPESFSPSSSARVWWQCPKDPRHEWCTPIGTRTAGSGCPFCSGKRAFPGETDLATLNPELAAQWHPAKNGDLMPQDVKPMSSRRVWWLCPEGHEWDATVATRSQGGGCPFCAHWRLLPGFNDLETAYPDVAALWHPTKNPGITPRQVTLGTKPYFWWQCAANPQHEWKAPAKDVINGKGCPLCAEVAAAAV